MLLLDENLSWRLVRSLQPNFPGTQHSSDAGLQKPISDQHIWDLAKRTDRMIVTNDEDFLHILMQKGFPPKVILLKIGNASTHQVADTLIRHRNDIFELMRSDLLGILEIYG
jgi:predicted nuclease of predicted toxin-antitoxin system